MYGVVVDYGNAVSLQYAKDKEDLIKKLRKVVSNDLGNAYSVKIYDLNIDEALAEFCELAEYRPKECRKVLK